MTLSHHILTEARRKAVETQDQADKILAEDFAQFIEDVSKVLSGVSPGFLRRPPQHEVRPAKVHVPAVDHLPEEGISK